MSPEPQHDLVDAPASPFDTALDLLRTRGWTVQTMAHGRRQVAVATGPAGILVFGSDKVEARTLHSRAGTVCAALPPALRRHVLVVEGDLQTALGNLDELPAVLFGSEVDQVTTALAELPRDADLTIGKVLEWTRNAKPEPKRTNRRHPMSGAARWLTRNAVLFAVIAVGLALLAVVTVGTSPQVTAADVHASPASSQVQHTGFNENP